ncbi:MAG: hypothetical protein NVSMB7_13930 [Chitinophagaceae bacterium]
MDNQEQRLAAIQDIKRIMERSSRFISLSGWSGIAAGICALGGAFTATYTRSRKEGVPVWGNSAQRLMFNTAIPLAAGAFVVYRMLELGEYGLIAPTSLIFYGLALVNGSKYTLGEVKYLGYSQVMLGIVNLWVPGNGLYFWALGFGILHIVYGGIMWWKYERQ